MSKLPKRFAPVLTGFLLSGFMTLIISGVATLRNIGVLEDFNSVGTILTTKGAWL
ncbi:MAG: DUF2798 domain-containing protein [Trueperaceae bacterium]